MQCFRCGNLTFNTLGLLFNKQILECSKCSQNFILHKKDSLEAVEFNGVIQDIEQSSTIKKCGFCETRRYIASSLESIDLVSCKLCGYKTSPKGGKIPLNKFLEQRGK
jgi:transcription elongation factor Elf1